MGSDYAFNIFCVISSISIHAPRMGSDRFSWRGLPPTVDISIHAPRMGSDTFAITVMT